MKDLALIGLGLIIFASYFYNENNQENQIPSSLIGFSICNFMLGFVMNIL